MKKSRAFPSVRKFDNMKGCSQPKISVVIPVHNAQEFLEQCLKSVFCQKISLEVICVDDCSTDASREIIKQYIRRGFPVSLIENEKNLFAGTCRNIGLEAATGEYVHFLDADDFLVDGAYAKLYAIAKENSLDVLRCDAYVYDNVTGSVGETAYYSHTSLEKSVFVEPSRFVLHAFSMLRGVVAPWAGLIRREFAIKNNILFNNLYCVNDRSFYFASIVKAQRIMFVHEFVIYYRQNNLNSLIGKRSQHYKCQFDSYEIIKTLAKDLPPVICRRMLGAELADICRWMCSFRSAPNWKDIRKDLDRFCKSLDMSLWPDNADSEPWKKQLQELFELDDLENRPSAYDYKVSVIIPMYNSAAYLSKCLESLRVQTLRSAEFICIDDGSTDATKEIVEQIMQSDPRFKLISQNHGYAGRARNLGISKARGECIAFLDSDDFFDKHFLQRMFAAYVKHGADVVICEANSFQGKTNEIKKASCYFNKALIPAGCQVVDPRKIADCIFNITPGNPWNKMFSHDFVRKEKLQFLKIRKSEDLYFVYLALASAKRIAFVDKPLVNYRIDNEDSLEHTKDENWSSFLTAYLSLQEELRRRKLYQSFRASFIKRAADACRYNLFGVSSYDSFCATYEELKRRGIKDLTLLKGGFLEENNLIVHICNEECGEFLFAQWRKERTAGEKLRSEHDVLKRRTGKLECENVRLKKLGSAVAISPASVNSNNAMRIKQLTREVAELKASTAYTVGMVVTWPARRMYRMLKCCRENGLKYTLRQIVYGKGHGRK